MHSFTSRDLLVSVFPEGDVAAVACATACTNEPTKGTAVCAMGCTNEPTATGVQRGWDADLAGDADLSVLERELEDAVA